MAVDGKSPSTAICHYILLSGKNDAGQPFPQHAILLMRKKLMQ